MQVMVNFLFIFINDLAKGVLRVLFKEFRTGIPACSTADAIITIDSNFHHNIAITSIQDIFFLLRDYSLPEQQ